MQAQPPPSTPLPSPRAIITSLIDEIATIPKPTSPNQHPNPLENLDPAARKLLITLHVLLPNETLPALDLLERGCVSRFVLKQVSPLAREDEDATMIGNRDDALGGDNTQGEGHGRIGPEEEMEKCTFAYYVQSASTHNAGHAGGGGRSRFIDKEAARHYEVRLDSWNCSCPAFAFNAFPAGRVWSGMVLGARMEGEGGNGRCEAMPDEGMMWGWDRERVGVEQGCNAGAGAGAGAGGESEDEEMLLDGEEGTARIGEGEQQKRNGNREWRFGGLGRGMDAPVCKHLLACLLGERCLLFRGFVQEKEVSVEEAMGWAAGWGA
ncbi:MAG: hypothetical protein M1820_009515 [Bogoriella megaspora]|nr:MAG: hypothetical protein M1820_009515 [Bogoriella megaspora]